MPEIDSVNDKAKKERSPSFPFISLKKAIDRAQMLADNHKRSPARLLTIAPTWGYSAKSSGLLQTVATLKQYGLIEDLGSGEDRKLQLTDLAWRILMDTRPGVKEKAIKEAALKPKLIEEYASQWIPSRPSDNHCVSELHLDRGFTPEAAKAFLRVFDETISFANLKEDDRITDEAEEVESGSPALPKSDQKIEINDLVQWESNGVLQFKQPRRVREITNDIKHGMYIFVEGSSTGIPFDEAVFIQKGNVMSANALNMGHLAHQQPIISSLLNRATFPLPEGMAALELPEKLSQESYDDLKDWFDLMLKRLQRRIS